MTVAVCKPGPISDQTLIAQVATGQLQALGPLFERYEPAVRRYLGYLGVAPADLDDLVQATFLEVIRAGLRFDPDLPARNWLLGIASMLVRRHRRSLGRQARNIAAFTRALWSEPTTARTPAEVVELDATLQRLQRRLARLPHKKREVFVLVTMEGLSGGQVADLLGIPINTVWTRLHHARRALRAALEEDPP